MRTLLTTLPVGFTFTQESGYTFFEIFTQVTLYYEIVGPFQAALVGYPAQGFFGGLQS